MDNSINTTINIIGSIPDYTIIYDVLQLLANDTPADIIRNSVILNNDYGIRTENSRVRVLNGIKNAFWQFKNSEHETLIRSLFQSDGLRNTQRFALFWMLGINNAIFENITINAFLKAYLSGRVQIKNDEIVAYLYHFRETNLDVQKWSDSTIDRVASKYLTFLKKIGFVTGRQKKEFKYIQIDDSSIIFFLYLIKAVDPNKPNILKNRYIDYIFIERSSIDKALRKAKYSDFFDMQTTGMDINIDLKYAYGEIIDAISSR